MAWDAAGRSACPGLVHRPPARAKEKAALPVRSQQTRTRGPGPQPPPRAALSDWEHRTGPG